MPAEAGAGPLRPAGEMTTGQDGKRKLGSNPLVRRRSTRSPHATAIVAARLRVTTAGDVAHARPHSCSVKAVWIPAFAGMTAKTLETSFPRSLSPRRRGAGIH